MKKETKEAILVYLGCALIAIGLYSIHIGLALIALGVLLIPNEVEEDTKTPTLPGESLSTDKP